MTTKPMANLMSENRDHLILYLSMHIDTFCDDLWGLCVEDTRGGAQHPDAHRRWLLGLADVSQWDEPILSAELKALQKRHGDIVDLVDDLFANYNVPPPKMTSFLHTFYMQAASHRSITSREFFNRFGHADRLATVDSLLKLTLQPYIKLHGGSTRRSKHRTLRDILPDDSVSQTPQVETRTASSRAKGSSRASLKAPSLVSGETSSVASSSFPRNSVASTQLSSLSSKREIEIDLPNNSTTSTLARVRSVAKSETISNAALRASSAFKTTSEVAPSVSRVPSVSGSVATSAAPGSIAASAAPESLAASATGSVAAGSVAAGSVAAESIAEANAMEFDMVHNHVASGISSFE